MTELIVTIGLPASGKSTWTKTMLHLGEGQVKRVSRDFLRDMLDNGRYTGDNEKVVLDVEEALMRRLLGQGFDVICDDTNLDPNVRNRWKVVASDMDADYYEMPFTEVPLRECIKRDKKRHKKQKGGVRVGREVIERMHAKWLAE